MSDYIVVHLVTTAEGAAPNFTIWKIWQKFKFLILLTHWGRVTYICVGKLTIIGSDNGLSPKWHQAIIWTNAGILLIGPLGTNFSELLVEIQTFSLKKIRLKMSSAKCCSFRFGLNVLKGYTFFHNMDTTCTEFQVDGHNMSENIDGYSARKM